MLNLRDKDISLIRNFFSLSTLPNSGYIPFVVAGTENGSGHNMIIRKFQQNKDYKIICFVTCHEFILDAFRPIYQIVKTLSSDENLKTLEINPEIQFWLNEYENENYSRHSEDFLIRLLSDYVLACSKVKSILLILENLHFGSYFLLNFLSLLSAKMDNVIPKSPLNILAFYRFEEFIDISLKKLIAETAEKGMVVTIRNVPQQEYLAMIEPFFSNCDQENVKKLWLITHGNILIFSQVLNHISKKLKPQENKFDLTAAVDILPDTTQKFYDLYLSRFTRLENEILETIAYITAPINQGFIEFLTKEQPQIVARAIHRLLKERIISQTSYVSERFNLVSFDLRHYILYRNSDEYKLGRYKYLLEKYENFYADNLDKHLLILRNLSIQALDKTRIYRYLKLLYATLPNSYNSFRRIEILYQLIMYETDTALLPDYVIKLCCALIEVGKQKSAIEILKKHGEDKSISTVDSFRIYLLLFELFISMEYYNSANKVSEILDRIYKSDFPVYLSSMYYQSKLRFLIAGEKFGEAMRCFSANLQINEFEIDYYLIIKAEIQLNLGLLNSGRQIFWEAYDIAVEKSDHQQICKILLKLSYLEQLAGNFEKAGELLTKCREFANQSEEIGKFPIKIMIAQANLYIIQHKFKEALESLYAALNIESTQTDPPLDSEIFCALGCYYQEIGSFEKAVSCFKRSKYNYLGFENMRKRIFYTLKLTECFAWFNNREEADIYYAEVENILKNDIYSQYKDNYFLSKARTALFLKEYDNALSFLEDMVCREYDRVLFINKSLLEMRIGYQLKNNSLIRDSADAIKPFFTEFGSYILHEVNRIKQESNKQSSDE